MKLDDIIRKLRLEDLETMEFAQVNVVRGDSDSLMGIHHDALLADDWKINPEEFNSGDPLRSVS